MRPGRGMGFGGHQGRNKGGAYGPGGYCICVKCGYKMPHDQGVKCTEIKCPECGHTMVREELVNNKKK
jgi:ribosomal protein S26